MARPRLVSDEQILTATRTAVVEKGAQVSLDAVAQQLGISSPALIKRFGTRQNLLLAALSPNLESLDAIFERPVDDSPIEGQLGAVIARLAHYFLETMPHLMTLRECGISHDVLQERIKAPIPLKAVTGLKRWLGSLHARELIEGDMLETVAMAVVGAVMTRVISAHLAQQAWPPKAQRKFQTELAALFTRALARTPESRTTKAVSRKNDRTRTSKS
jgi:AcrR family transcriptional regulator